MHGIEFRKAETVDLRDIHGIETESFPDGPWDMEVFVSLLTESDVHFMVACCGDAVVGYYLLSFKPPAHSKIGTFAVKPSHRRAGIAKLMIHSIFDTCSINDREDVMLEVEATNEAAIVLYKSFGFVAESREEDYYGEGKDGCIMWRRAK